MNFEAYLTAKKIDAQKFRNEEPETWQEWSLLFEQVSEGSFTSQKLYLINPIRRKYSLVDSPSNARPEATPRKPASKPKIS
jgi:hypothetical protein